MITVSLQDINFINNKGISQKEDPRNVEWDRYGVHKNAVFTDSGLLMAKLPQYKDSKKIALILEPYSIDPKIYHWIRFHYDIFDLVLTHHEDWANKVPNAQYYPNLMTWIDKEDRGLHKKTKNISMLISSKQITPLQKVRHQLKNKVNVDVFGDGKWVENKADTLRDYRFSVAIENSSEPGYFSEKIIDCFLTGTVPIYIGDPNIGDNFDKSGIIICDLNNIEEKIRDIELYGEDIYKEMEKYVEYNYLNAIDLGLNVEDWLYKEGVFDASS